MISFLSSVSSKVFINVTMTLVYLYKSASTSKFYDTLQTPALSLTTFFWEEAKWCSQRIPLLNNYPLRWNSMTIYGLLHLFQLGSKTLIASKIPICGSAESGFIIISVGLECDSVCPRADWCLCVYA